jgi:hypothetical protein
LGARDGLDMPRIRQGLNTVDDEASEPRESYPYGTAKAPPGEPFAQHTLEQPSCLTRDEVWLRVLHRLAWARLALMLLFAMMGTAVLLAAGGATGGAGVSADQSYR